MDTSDLMQKVSSYQTWILMGIILLLIILVIYFATSGRPAPDPRQFSNLEDVKLNRYAPERRTSRKAKDLVYDTNSLDPKPDEPSTFVQYPKVEEPPKEAPGQETKKAPPGKWKTEAKCREVLEEMFGVPFPSVMNLPWLRNPKTGRHLQLDCYNADLGLALEYHGHQHYEFPNHYHKSKQEFEAQVYRDTIKRQLCDQNGVYLITVPYTVPKRDLYKYIEYYLPSNRRQRLDLGLTN